MCCKRLVDLGNTVLIIEPQPGWINGGWDIELGAGRQARAAGGLWPGDAGVGGEDNRSLTRACTGAALGMNGAGPFRGWNQKASCGAWDVARVEPFAFFWGGGLVCRFYR